MAAHWVWLAGLLFIATHLGISSTALRPALLARWGQPAYLGVYSLLAFVSLALLIWTYVSTLHVPFVWPPLTLLPQIVMPIALLFIVGGFTVPNPTSVGAEAKLGDAARGMLRITRHPVQWGLLLWAASHLLANSDLPSIAFFGSMALVSAVGMLAMDARKSKLGSWTEFAATTSLVPFVAIAGGRNTLEPRELMRPLLIALPVTAAIWWLHPYLSGGVSLL